LYNLINKKWENHVPLPGLHDPLFSRLIMYNAFSFGTLSALHV